MPSRVYSQIKEIKQLPKQMRIYTKLGNRQVSCLFYLPVSFYGACGAEPASQDDMRAAAKEERPSRGLCGWWQCGQFSDADNSMATAVGFGT